MANTKKKDDVRKEESVVENQPLLLTEEEFARRQRKKNKERINKVIRIVGLIGTFILFFGAIFDVLFELSYFGWMRYSIWPQDVVISVEELVVNEEGVIVGSGVFHDQVVSSNPHDFAWEELIRCKAVDLRFFGANSDWLPKLGITILLVMSTVALLYLTIYCIIDLVELIRSGIKLMRDLSEDLEGTANDGGISLKRKKKPEPEPFQPTKRPQPRRRKESSSLDNMSDEDLDKILRGEKIVDDKLEKEVSYTKDLFAEDEE